MLQRIQNSYFKLSNLPKGAAIVIIVTKTEDVEGSEFCQPTYATIPFKKLLGMEFYKYSCNMQNTWMLMASSIYIHLLVKSVPVYLLKGYCFQIENVLTICQTKQCFNT